MKASQLIEEVLSYAEFNLHADPRDRDYLRNRLFELFGSYEQYVGPLNPPQKTPKELFDKLTTYGEDVLKRNGDQFATEVMGIVLPLPSVLQRRFWDIGSTDGIQEAADDFYETCIASNYIRMSDIERNEKWLTNDDIPLEITINLSKPEKSNKTIVVEETKQRDYPKCPLCHENEGYVGDAHRPPRSNLRTLELTLNGDRWFMQYSPYLYLNEHCIVISEEHRKMEVNEETIDYLLDFVTDFPTYFLGSNAALPIIGGSILGHAHFQGGRHLMPMFKAEIRKHYYSAKNDELELGILDWHGSVVRVGGKDRASVTEAAKKIIKTWRDFDAPEINLLSHTGEVLHNSLAPIAHRVRGQYIVDCVLRNNRTNRDFPEGIFHVAPSRQNIKSEAIGLIESMGLFILPGRLKNEMSEIRNIVSTGDRSLINEGLAKHRHWIESLISRVGGQEFEQVVTTILEDINQTCKEILVDTAVFKNTEQGATAFDRFIKQCGFEERK